MSERLSPAELAAIRERRPHTAWEDRDKLLAHLDALADEINRLTPEERSGIPRDGWFHDGFSEGLDAAAALVRRGAP